METSHNVTDTSTDMPLALRPKHQPARTLERETLSRGTLLALAQPPLREVNLTKKRRGLFPQMLTARRSRRYSQLPVCVGSRCQQPPICVTPYSVNGRVTLALLTETRA